MKLSKQILEAVHRGIQLALDDYQDNEPNSSLSPHNDVIDSEDVIKQKYDLMNEVVDLGLPSRTLWCKYNLGVNPNRLTNAEDWYGDYYAWGELTPNKNSWTEGTYKFTGKMKKYNNYDKLTNLLPEDDAAYQFKKYHSFKLHIPTKEQCEELIQYTTVSEYHENYNNVERLNGYILTSNINSNEIFIPAAGYYGYGGFQNRAMVSCAARCEKDPYKCYVLQYYSRGNEFILNDALYRTNGYPIRPVVIIK